MKAENKGSVKLEFIGEYALKRMSSRIAKKVIVLIYILMAEVKNNKDISKAGTSALKHVETIIFYDVVLEKLL